MRTLYRTDAHLMQIRCKIGAVWWRNHLKEEKAMDYQLFLGDCLEIMPTLEAGSVQLIATDPPYFRVKDDDWDNQWATADAFLQWMDRLCIEWKRILTPNGSLYVFASPQMAWHVEGVIRRHFNVLNSIRWLKNDNASRRHEAQVIDSQMARAYFPDWEACIFAEPFSADNTYQNALIGENSTYWQACERAKQSIIGDYLQGEFDRAGVTRKEIAALFPSRTGNLTGCVSNWLIGYNIPTREQYEAMRDYLNSRNCKKDYLRREYEDLRREYEDLRREYEDLRRPFYATPDAPYTDVWTFPTVNTYPGKHPAEKPLELMRHIIRVSSRPGDTVLDCFLGSGTTGHAAGVERRKFIGMEKDARWYSKAQRRTAAAYGDWETAQQVRTIHTATHEDLPLFATV